MKRFIKVISLILIFLSFTVIHAEDPDKVVIYFLSEPGVEIHTNGQLTATIGISGSAGLYFQFGASFFVSAVAGENYIQVGEPEIISVSDDKIVVLIPVKKAGYIGVISNVYPLSVFVDGEYYGRIENVEDTLKIPAGEHELTLKAPGFEPERFKIFLEWKEKKYLKVTFKEIPLSVELVLPRDSFSPNGDWDNDELKIGVLLTKNATCNLLISNGNGVVYERNFQGREGMNWFYWDGRGKNGKILPDGEYILKVECGRIVKETKFKIDTTRYTYKKEITLGTLGLILAGIIALIYWSVK